MILSIGDIVEYKNPQAGKLKYHLCLRPCAPEVSAYFLFINSKSGFAADCVFHDGAFPCIPPSPTGQSVVSFSQLIRASERQLHLFQASIIGQCSPIVAATLATFNTTSNALTRDEKAIVAEALAQIK